MFSRDIQSNIRELTRCEYVDGEARDRDGEMKHRRADYANERRGAQENSLALGDKALVTEKNENKLLTTFEDTPYKVTNKQRKAMESQWNHLKELTTGQIKLRWRSTWKQVTD